MAELKDGTFAEQVFHSDQPTLVEFWAPWCKPCTFLQPVLDEASAQLGNAVKFVRLNVDENPIAATVYGVKSVPTLILFRGEDEVQKMAGFVGKEELLRRIHAGLAERDDSQSESGAHAPDDGTGDGDRE